MDREGIRPIVKPIKRLESVAFDPAKAQVGLKDWILIV